MFKFEFFFNISSRLIVNIAILMPLLAVPNVIVVFIPRNVMGRQSIVINVNNDALLKKIILIKNYAGFVHYRMKEPWLKRKILNCQEKISENIRQPVRYRLVPVRHQLRTLVLSIF